MQRKRGRILVYVRTARRARRSVWRLTAQSRRAAWPEDAERIRHSLWTRAVIRASSGGAGMTGLCRADQYAAVGYLVIVVIVSMAILPPSLIAGRALARGTRTLAPAITAAGSGARTDARPNRGGRSRLPNRGV